MDWFEGGFTKNTHLLLHKHIILVYREFYSTEIALLRVQNDILRAIDDKNEVLLVLLDLSAAFDT